MVKSKPRKAKKLRKDEEDRGRKRQRATD